MSKLLKIIPPPTSDGGSTHYVAFHGSKIVTPNGEALPGITKVVITGQVDDIWRAELSCLIEPPDFSLIGDVYTRTEPTRWQQFKRWLRYGRIKPR